MKKYLLILILLIPVSGFGQRFEEAEHLQRQIWDRDMHDRIVRQIFFDTDSNFVIIEMQKNVWDWNRVDGYTVITKEIWREYYGIRDSKMQLIKKVNGKIIPKHTVPESIKWDKIAKESANKTDIELFGKKLRERVRENEKKFDSLFVILPKKTLKYRIVK